MRKYLLATGILAARAVASASANAADLPVYKAPPPIAVAPILGWTGCYIGGNVGGGWTGQKECTPRSGQVGDLRIG